MQKCGLTVSPTHPESCKEHGVLYRPDNSIVIYAGEIVPQQSLVAQARWDSAVAFRRLRSEAPAVDLQAHAS
jgi:hypothetical protein